MPLPTSYTEETFKAYLHGRLNQGGVADAFGWSVAGGSYDEIVNDTLLAYGAADVASAGHVAKLRALGNLALWQAVKEAATLEVDYSADGASFSREAIFRHADAMLAQARLDARPYDADYEMNILGVVYRDPYEALDL